MIPHAHQKAGLRADAVPSKEKMAIGEKPRFWIKTNGRNNRPIFRTDMALIAV
jgi:hypothetical protein